MPHDQRPIGRATTLTSRSMVPTVGSSREVGMFSAEGRPVERLPHRISTRRQVPRSSGMPGGRCDDIGTFKAAAMSRAFSATSSDHARRARTSPDSAPARPPQNRWRRRRRRGSRARRGCGPPGPLAPASAPHQRRLLPCNHMPGPGKEGLLAMPACEKALTMSMACSGLACAGEQRLGHLHRVGRADHRQRGDAIRRRVPPSPSAISEPMLRPTSAARAAGERHQQRRRPVGQCLDAFSGGPSLQPWPGAGRAQAHGMAVVREPARQQVPGAVVVAARRVDEDDGGSAASTV